ncbi:MAG: PEP-CTERM sorting domain-containing protein [Nitrospirae bacterium]|nr:PEP-CTERM sorting domain-containing protein [Nitrospirota bacterium]
MKIVRVFLLVVSIMFISSMAFGAVDTIQAPTGYFTPDDASKYSSPYYRWHGEGWSWTHNPIAGTLTSASLNISAFDVDYDGVPGYYAGERDAIYAYDNGVRTFLGYLAGANDVWAFTDFTLGSNFFDDVNAGLMVEIEIDTTYEGWAVSLAKSALTTDGSNPGNPNPGPAVPEPSTIILLGSGLAGAALLRKKFKKN